MTPKPRQPLFRKGYQFTAVKPLHLGELELMPGDPIPKDVIRLFRIQRLYKKRQIGVANTPWTLWAIETGNPKMGDKAIAEALEKALTQDQFAVTKKTPAENPPAVEPPAPKKKAPAKKKAPVAKADD